MFSLKTPSSFFTMFGNQGGAASADLAIEAFEDDVKVVGRTVCQIRTANEWKVLISPVDPEHPRDDERESLYPVLPARPSSTARSARWPARVLIIHYGTATGALPGQPEQLTLEERDVRSCWRCWRRWKGRTGKCGAFES